MILLCKRKMGDLNTYNDIIDILIQSLVYKKTNPYDNYAIIRFITQRGVVLKGLLTF